MAAKKSKSGKKKVSSGSAKKVGKRAAKVPAKVARVGTKQGSGSTLPAPRDVKSVTRSSVAGKPKGAAAKGKPAATTTTKKRPLVKLAKATTKGLRSKERSGRSDASAPLDSEVNPSPSVPSESMRSALGLGDCVPDFETVDQTGHKVSNRDWAGAPYVIYFYPKDDTPGCTTEACGFRDELPAFDELGVKVVGCSPDSPSAHTRFATKYGLQFTLLADIEKDLAQLFGVWKLKQNYGREYMGVERSTFLIDKGGKIARQWRAVRVAGHVAEVLQAVRELD